MSFPALQDLLQTEVSTNLFVKLVDQIEKDFLLTGINYNFENLTPTSLVVCLHEVVEHLLSKKFSVLLALLYRIDLPQSILNKNIEGYTVEESIVIHVLKREWQKIMLKQKYS